MDTWDLLTSRLCPKYTGFLEKCEETRQITRIVQHTLFILQEKLTQIQRRLLYLLTARFNHARVLHVKGRQSIRKQISEVSCVSYRV